MDKTIKYLEDKGFFTKLKVSTAMSDTLFERLIGIKCPEKAKREAYKDLIMREVAKDKALLNAIINDVTDEIIKHI